MDITQLQPSVHSLVSFSTVPTFRFLQISIIVITILLSSSPFSLWQYLENSDTHNTVMN